MQQQAGFTLLELILVLVLMALGSAYIAPRLEFNSFRETGDAQQLLALLRHAQTVARSSECAVEVRISGAQVSLHYAETQAPCSTNPVIDASSGTAWQLTLSDNISGNSGWTFNALGLPSTGAQSFSLHGQSYQLSAETGYVAAN